MGFRIRRREISLEQANLQSIHVGFIHPTVQTDVENTTENFPLPLFIPLICEQQ